MRTQADDIRDNIKRFERLHVQAVNNFGSESSLAKYFENEIHKNKSILLNIQ